MSVVASALPADAPLVEGLPDPFAWSSGLVRIFGEARCRRRPWVQVWPLVDLPVVAELWPHRRERHQHLLHVVKTSGDSRASGGWEMTVLVREELRFRAVALRLEPAARTPYGHHGPPGPRYVPMGRLDPSRTPEAWLATALHLL